MDLPDSDQKLREALTAVGKYLSDTIPPFQAADGVAALLEQPPQLMVSEILQWVSEQKLGNGADVSRADYLIHAVSKMHYLAHLQLIPGKALTEYLDSVKELLWEHCSEKDIPVLQEGFSCLENAEIETVSALSLMYRPKKPEESNSTGEKSPGARQARERSFSILRERMQISAQKSADGPANESREDLVPHMVAAAAADARNSEELRKLQENLKALGICSGTDQIYRTLSQSLPGWMIASSDEDAVKSHNPAIEAMSQIIHLSENRLEASRRFQDLVQAAIGQFNAGSFARAASMLDLAIVLGSGDKVDPSTVAGIRKTSHESLDPNRLRTLAKDTNKRVLLRKILNFFDQFTVENMLNSLKKEENRTRRRLFLDLLEAQGDDARARAFDHLNEILGNTNIAVDWYFARNLICILSRIPRTNEAAAKTEVERIAPLLRLSLPASLVKEAIRFVGRSRCPESEELLISMADNLESVVDEQVQSGKDTTQKLSLLDRTIFAIAHYGTPKAYRRVVKHGISPKKGMGDAASRLTYLSRQDLTADPGSLADVIKFLKKQVPRKLLGLTIRRNDQALIHAVKALSSTPAPIVRETLEFLATRFPETMFGQISATILREFASLDNVIPQSDRILTGDLDLFGIPDLFRQLRLMQATGTLVIKDAQGNPAGTLSLVAGRMQDCSAGHLEGVNAAYQLIEKPMPGTFFFQGQRSSDETTEQPDDNVTYDLSEILTEGMCRYDELQRTRALVPDFCVLKRGGSDQYLPLRREDPDLFNLIWQEAVDGISPEGCETIYPADACHIRGALANLVENGVLSMG